MSRGTKSKAKTVSEKADYGKEKESAESKQNSTEIKLDDAE
jgi:hypothetical protein